MPKIITWVSCVIISVVLMCSATQEALAAKVFHDLSTQNGHYESVQYLNEQGIYNYKGNQFGASQAVTRGETAKILYNLFADDLPKIRVYQNQFTDVHARTSFSKEIIWAYEIGIFDGNAVGEFQPNEPVKRVHLAKILVNSFQLESKGTYELADVKRSHWAYDYVSILYGNSITTGDEKGRFLPNVNVTNGQLASFLVRALHVVEARNPVFDEPRDSLAKYDSEYDFVWHLVGRNEQLELEGVLDNRVVARYLTQYGAIFDKAPDVLIGNSSKADVEKLYPEPVTVVNKHNAAYFINEGNNGEYTIHLIDGYYVTFFYDVHKQNQVRSILAIYKGVEESKEGFYGTKEKLLQSREASELLMVELMSQARMAEGMQPLQARPQWKEIARKHSEDMIAHDYFDHVNLLGQQPADRAFAGGMESERMTYFGENIAYGLFNMIYAHEGFMNSLGHRVNILNPVFEYAFVGIAYKETASYVTVNFYSTQ